MEPWFFPLKYWQQVSAPAVKSAIEDLFDKWGPPERMRVDNGAPWGSSGDLPPELALWLIGLGIDVTWNAPRRPQENGVIERSQGTGKRWSEPRRCATAADLQRRIDEADCIQREVYPSVEGKSRSTAYPELRRPEPQAWRRRRWSLDRVLEHLADYALVRRVDAVGKVSVYGHDLYVGKPWIRKTVFVTLDPFGKEWIVSDERGVMLRSKPAAELTETNILALTMNDRPAPPSGKTKWPRPPAKLAGR